MLHKTKWVPITQCKVGDRLTDIKVGNCYTMATRYIVAMTDGFTTFALWTPTGKTEIFSNEGLYAEVPMSDQEYKNQWKASAVALRIALAEPISQMDWSSHDWDNGWIEDTIWEMADSLHDRNYDLIGWFPLETLYRDFDIGMAVHDKRDDQIFWVHWKLEYIINAIKEYDEYVTSGR